MKNLLIISLLMLSSTFYSQNQVILTDCEEPQTYNTSIVIYTPDPCNWVGTYEVLPTPEIMYPTLQVAALKSFPTYLPLGYMTKRVNGLWKVYMHPDRYVRLYNPTQAAEDDGFCNTTKVTLIANPFPGTYSN